jgi:3-dehydroquinate synthase
LLDKTRPSLAAVTRQDSGDEQVTPATVLTGTRQITVTFDYCLEFTRGIFRQQNLTLVQAISRKEADRIHQLVCYVDAEFLNKNPGLPDALETYARAHSSSLELLAPPMAVSAGEAGKAQSVAHTIQQHMLGAGIDRQSVVIAIGGGAALDVIGYAAATFHRGIRLVRLPTTVLAQNDAGVGVKNGINAFGIKNLLGSFAPPFAVINDSEFLNSLSARDRRAGIAEAVKVAAIRDRSFFEWIESHVQALGRSGDPAMDYLIKRCAELHLNQIARGGDPFEMGSARPLDYGHWSAHKLEALSHYELRHGEAVAIGMALDALYASNIGLLERSEVDRFLALLEELGFVLFHPAMEGQSASGQNTLLQGLEEFRQHLGGHLCVTLLSKIGTGIEVGEMLSSEILRARSELKARWLERGPRCN